MKKYATIRYCCSGHSLLSHEQLSSFSFFTFYHADQLTGSSQLLFTICRDYLGFVWLKAAVWCGWKCKRLQSALLNQIMGITIETATIPLCNVLLIGLHYYQTTDRNSGIFFITIFTLFLSVLFVLFLNGFYTLHSLLILSPLNQPNFV